MSKQTEIREAIDTYTDDTCLYPNKLCQSRGTGRYRGYCSSQENAYRCLMLRLDELGVVIKLSLIHI